MTPEFAYLLKVNIAFGLFYAFYRLFFYKDTFFKLRRGILLAFFVLALAYPFFNIQDWVKQQEPIAEVIMVYSSIIGPEATVSSGNTTGLYLWKDLFMSIIGLAYLGIVLCLTFRFLLQFGSILWLAYKSPKEAINGVPVHILEKPAGPFSFFKLIFLHPQSHSEKELDEIMTHECTHVSQWHSLDVMLSELISVIFWYNPFVWLLKREVRHNLEYLADNRVIESGYDCRSYQYHLLGLAHQHKGEANLYNSFNVLHLKNRIGMMNKKRTHGIGRTKYLFFIPLIAMLMLVSNMEAVARITRNVARDIASSYSVLMNETSSSGWSAKSNFLMEMITPGITASTDQVKDEVHTVVQRMPRFPGGDAALLKFISNSIKYPEDAVDAGISGRVVSSFVVTKEGRIEDVEVIRSIYPSLDAEAVRVIKTMPLWEPGRNGEEPVNVRYTVPIQFRLSDAKPEKMKEMPANHTFTVVEKMPQFPGGDRELLKFIGSSIKYPVLAQENNIQGRVVISFIVNTDGTVVEPEVIRRIDPSLDAEALRVVKNFPKWNPGEQRGKPVRVKYTVPIQFRLQ